MATCDRCSAPLSPKSTVCGYCGSHNDIDLKGIHEYTIAKPEKERLCPACEIPMESLDLNLEGRFFIERCRNCMGHFFDSGELESLLDKTLSPTFHIDFERLARISEEYGHLSRTPYVKCPLCQKHMNQINFGARSGVVVDQCRDHGIWLNGGEFHKLLAWRKAGGELLHEKREKEKETAPKKRAPLPSGGASFPTFGTPPRRSGENIVEDLVDIIFRLFSY